MRTVIAKIACWAALLSALGLGALSMLTLVRAPISMEWHRRMFLGILVGEYGQRLAVVALVLGIVAWFLRRVQPLVTATTAGICAVALVLLFKPTIQAWAIGRALPMELAGAFGADDPGRVAFSVWDYAARGPETTPIHTLDYTALLKLDFYRAIGRENAPCLIDIHGGAWFGGSRGEGDAVRRSNRWFAQHGYAVASIDYRLVPYAIWPAQRDDILTAINYLRANSSELGIDGTRIVLVGRSAGGQLAEAVGYSAHDPGIRGVAAFYAPSDMALSWTSMWPGDSFNQRQILQKFLGGTPSDNPDAYANASGVLLADRDAPPTLLIHGRLDTLVPWEQSELMNQRLAALGVPHLLISLPWGTHGFDYASFTGPGGQITTFALKWFVDAVTK